LRLADAAAGYLIALHRGRNVLEQQCEPALVLLVAREVAARERTVDDRLQLAIEADLAPVDAEPHAGGAAGGVRRGQLEHDRRRSPPLCALVAEADPAALAPLDRAGLLERKGGHRARPERRGQPRRIEVSGRADDPVGVTRHRVDRRHGSFQGQSDYVCPAARNLAPALNGKGAIVGDYAVKRIDEMEAI